MVFFIYNPLKMQEPVLKQRYIYLDVIRGLAICTMLVANSAATYLAPEHPFWFRLIGTFAAPIFICTAGYLLGRGLIKGQVSGWKNLYRGFLTLGIAACIDIFVWNTMPFTTFDVLYLIGFGICLFPLYSKLSKYTSLTVSLFIIVVPQLIFRDQYRLEISELTIDETSVSLILHSWQALFLDGWFPLFPWLGLMFFSVWVGRYKPESKKPKNSFHQLIPVCIFIGGIIMLYCQNKVTRSGYSELFYPPDLIYMITAISLLNILWQNTELLNNKLLTPLTWLGRSSLFFYILHCILIKYILSIIFPQLGENYLILLPIFIGSLLIIGYGLSVLKKKNFWEKMPWIFHFIFGN